MATQVRINKYLRDKGLASRREADKLIEGGLVFVNGKRALMGMLVNEADNVEVRGKQKEMHYLAYYKPRGLSTQDFPGKPSVMTEWKSKGLYPVGRLDKDSEGLLILTNDGRLVTEILSESPKYEKEYVVNVKEHLRAGIPAILESGMDTKILGKLLPAKARIISPTTINIILREGKKHQIRIMLDELHYTITSLKRIRVGQIRLGDLKPGQTRPILEKLLQ